MKPPSSALNTGSVGSRHSQFLRAWLRRPLLGAEAQGVVGEEGMIRVYRSGENEPCFQAANKGYKGLRLKEAGIIGVAVESRREEIWKTAD